MSQETQPPREKQKLELSCSAYFLDWLSQASFSIALTTYQTNRLFLLGRKPDGRLSAFERMVQHPLGLFTTPDRLTLCTRHQIWQFDNVLAHGEDYKGYDALFIPRRGYTTGALDAHDVAVDRNGRIVFVNTRFSCLATLSERHSFKALWQPPFVTALSPEDRCHLNGLALVDGEPRYMTAISRSDVADGWRDRRATSGTVMDITTDEIVCTGLSMPHSPRWYQGRLWLLNSGMGELGYIEEGRFVPVAFVPGYGRGLCFVDHYAIIGLSKPRHNRAFTGLPLNERLEEKDAEAKCGIWVIDLNTGHTAHWLTFEGVVMELYDVQVLPGLQCPMALGFKTDEIHRLITVETKSGVAMHALALDDQKAGSKNGQPSQSDPSSGKTPVFQGIKLSAREIVAHYDAYTFPRFSKRIQLRSVQEPLLGLAAMYGGAVAGAVIMEQPAGHPGANLLSCWVHPEYRNKGLGTALLKRAALGLKQSGVANLEAQYRSNWSGTPAFEHMLEKLGWEAPRISQVLCIQHDVSRLTEARWYKHTRLPDGMTLFPWERLTESERRQIESSHVQQPWFPAELSPFQLPNLLEPSTSFGLRRGGQVVGWIIRHQVKPDLLQCTALFVREGEAPGGGIFLLRKSIGAQIGLGVQKASFMIGTENRKMLAFMRRNLAPYGMSEAENRIVGKRLE